MAVEVIMPKLGMTMEKGTIVRWLRGEGEAVEKGEPILEISTEKVNFQVEAPASGVLAVILAPPRCVVKVTEVVAVIAEAGEDPAAIAARYAAKKRAPEVAAPVSVAEEVGGAQREVVRAFRPRGTPAARRIARERGLDLRGIQGSGPGGRIVARDVLQAGLPVRSTAAARKAAAELGVDWRRVAAGAAGKRVTVADVLAAAPQQPEPLSATGGPTPHVIPFEGPRKIIAERMALSVRTAPQATLWVCVDMAAADELKRELAPVVERKVGVRLTYTDVVVKAAAAALRDHPLLNSTLVGEEIHILPEVNIGVAVAVPDGGLLVPVLRRADEKSLAAIAAARTDLVGRAREGRLLPDDLAGGTFTVSNLGMEGVDWFAPIINPPEAAILGVGRVAERPVVREGRVVGRLTVHLSLSFDHRIVNGAEGAAFLEAVRGYLERPAFLLA